MWGNSAICCKKDGGAATSFEKVSENVLMGCYTAQQYAAHFNREQFIQLK